MPRCRPVGTGAIPAGSRRVMLALAAFCAALALLSPAAAAPASADCAISAAFSNVAGSTQRLRRPAAAAQESARRAGQPALCAYPQGRRPARHPGDRDVRRRVAGLSHARRCPHRGRQWPDHDRRRARRPRNHPVRQRRRHLVAVRLERGWPLPAAQDQHRPRRHQPLRTRDRRLPGRPFRAPAPRSSATRSSSKATACPTSTWGRSTNSPGAIRRSSISPTGWAGKK